MSDKIADAISALQARDATAYRKARAAMFDAESAYQGESKALAELGRKPYRALEAYLVGALKPHRVEWRHTAPSDVEHGSRDVNHSDWTSNAYLSGVVTTVGPWKSRTSAHVHFSMAPRDADEFRRQVAILKAGMDAMAEAGL